MGDTVFIQLLIVALKNTLYIVYRVGKRGGLEEKNCLGKKRHKQEVTANEILDNKMKTASCKQELLIKIEIFPPKIKSLRRFASRKS